MKETRVSGVTKMVWTMKVQYRLNAKKEADVIKIRNCFDALANCLKELGFDVKDELRDNNIYGGK